MARHRIRRVSARSRSGTADELSKGKKSWRRRRTPQLAAITDLGLFGAMSSDNPVQVEKKGGGGSRCEEAAKKPIELLVWKADTEGGGGVKKRAQSHMAGVAAHAKHKGSVKRRGGVLRLHEILCWR